MGVRILEAAELELDEAVEYYDAESPGLGDEFLVEFIKSVERISNYPNAWHPFSKVTRRCLLNRFPYCIIYYIEDDTINVIAVACLHRKPQYWKNRLESNK